MIERDKLPALPGKSVRVPGHGVRVCYLPILDRLWQRRHRKGKLQAHLVRYADDFVVMCRKDVEEPLKVVRHVLDRLGLSLNEAKTHIVDATQASFNLRFPAACRGDAGVRAYRMAG